MDTTRRSIAKAISYRLFGTLTTTSLVLAATSKLELAAAVGLADTLFKVVVYILHERAWNRISYGRLKPEPDYTI